MPIISITQYKVEKEVIVHILL